MISKPTVLILGAGSSVHCGYPLGRDLVAQLCQLRGSAELDRFPDGWTRNGVERFLTKLSFSDPSSIDAFLETNRDDAPLGKFLIARQLKKCEDIHCAWAGRRSGSSERRPRCLIAGPSINLRGGAPLTQPPLVVPTRSGHAGSLLTWRLIKHTIQVAEQSDDLPRTLMSQAASCRPATRVRPAWRTEAHRAGRARVQGSTDLPRGQRARRHPARPPSAGRSGPAASRSARPAWDGYRWRVWLWPARASSRS